MTVFYNSAGNKIVLAEKIGSGGEGNVYKVSSQKNIVAKIYHNQITTQKQHKIKAMAESADDVLRKITAWPLDTLHKIKNGDICGFIMPDITGCEPLHHIYSPSHRKQQFPDMDWVFLINTCRNIAAAFGAIHARGHVIGDVNPNLVFVSSKTIAKFIDCDSFQITYAGKTYPCEVGVPHFTPPELQDHTSFKGISRTKNHDNFGLSLLIFHILMMGRHPFSGVYSGSIHMPLEKLIKQFLYAFSDNPVKKSKITPPPNSITPDILSDEIKMLFEQAFSESGSRFHRPTAKEWLNALDSFKQKLRNCTQSTIHKYYNRLSNCSWCRLEAKGIFYFLPSSSDNGNQGRGFNKDSVWKKILSITPPKDQPSDTTAQLKYLSGEVKSKEITQELIDKKNNVIFKKIAAIFIIIGCYAVWPEGMFFSLFPAGYLFFSKADFSTERYKRSDVLSKAEQQLSVLNRRWDNEANTSIFHEKVIELRRYYDEYNKLNLYYQSELNELEKNKRKLQLIAYLKKFYISDARIKGVGVVRKSDLASFGIETAADVQWSNVIRVPGFGQKYTREVVDWRKGIERRFTFNPSQAIDPAEISKLKNKIAKLKRNLESKLLSGPEQLIQIRTNILQKRNILSPQITITLRNVAQARADLQVL